MLRQHRGQNKLFSPVATIAVTYPTCWNSAAAEDYDSCLVLRPPSHRAGTAKSDAARPEGFTDDSVGPRLPEPTTSNIRPAPYDPRITTGNDEERTLLPTTRPLRRSTRQLCRCVRAGFCGVRAQLPAASNRWRRSTQNSAKRPHTCPLREAHRRRARSRVAVSYVETTSARRRVRRHAVLKGRIPAEPSSIPEALVPPTAASTCDRSGILRQQNQAAATATKTIERRL